MEDLIKRSDATEMVYKALRTPPLKGALTDTMSLAVALVQDIPSADRPQEWIPCSERLPEYRELVNVTTRDLRVKLAYLDSIQEDGTDDFWTMPLDDANCALWNIAAWMPLPEPWKGADDD